MVLIRSPKDSYSGFSWRFLKGSLSFFVFSITFFFVRFQWAFCFFPTAFHWAFCFLISKGFSDLLLTVSCVLQGFYFGFSFSGLVRGFSWRLLM